MNETEYETVRKQHALFINSSKLFKIKTTFVHRADYSLDNFDVESMAFSFAHVLIRLVKIFTSSALKNQGLLSRIRGMLDTNTVKRDLREHEMLRRRVVQFVASSSVLKSQARTVQDGSHTWIMNDPECMNIPTLRDEMNAIHDTEVRKYVLALGSIVLRLGQVFVEDGTKPRKVVKDSIRAEFYGNRFTKRMLAKIYA